MKWTALAIFGAAAVFSNPACAAETASDLSHYVDEAASRFSIPSAWIWAVIHVESRANSRAISNKGAMGLMQLMPGTWAHLRSTYGLGSDPFDVRDNIIAGAAYLREMYDRYGNPGFLAAYNAGPGRYEDYVQRGRHLPAETVAYVTSVNAKIDAGGDGIGMPSPLKPVPITWKAAPLFVASQANSVATDTSPFEASATPFAKVGSSGSDDP